MNHPACANEVTPAGMPAGVCLPKPDIVQIVDQVFVEIVIGHKDSPGRNVGLPCFFLDFCPGVFETHCQVENGFDGCGIGIEAEVTRSLELDIVAYFGFSQRGLRMAIFQRFQRMGIDNVLQLAIVWPLDGKQLLVQSHLCRERALRRDPMDCGFDFTAVGRISPARGRVVRAVDFGDFARFILDHVRASDQIGIAQADFVARE